MNQFSYPRLGEVCHIEKATNGLRICVVPRPDYAKTFAFFAADYGGMDRAFRMDGKDHSCPMGVAHFLEHKMFDMPEGNALQMLSEMGAQANAFTTSSITGYYFSCTERFRDCLKLLLRFVSQPYFTPESVNKEQGIIAQEIRMIEDDPGWQVYQNLKQALYHHHPVRDPVAGTVESVSKITDRILYQCHKAFYRPENMVLCVVGNVDPREVVLTAAQVLPPAEPCGIYKNHGDPEPQTPACGEVCKEMEVSAPNFLLGFKLDAGCSLRRQLVGELAGELLIGTSSPLYARLYGQGLIDQSFSVNCDLERETGMLFMGGESRDPGAVAEAILEESLRLSRGGGEDALFRRLKKAAYGNRFQTLDSPEHMGILLAEQLLMGNRYFDFAQEYDTISKEEAEQFLAEAVVRERMTLSLVIPKEGTEQ